jgi:hypothetical protein
MTYIYKELNTSDIAQELCNDEYASWYRNPAACYALAEYLDQLACDMGRPIELDTVAIRCDYSLMDNLADFNRQYGKECETLDDVREFTQVIEIENGESFIIGEF